MIEKDDVRRTLAGLGLSRKNICVHSSMRTLGDLLQDGLDGFVDAFLEEGCTLMVPTFSDIFAARPIAGYMPEQNGTGDYSDLLQREYGEGKGFTTSCKDISIEKMGVLPRHILCASGSLRGNHPLNSFTALGPSAAELVGGQTPRDVYAPFRRLRDSGGAVLLIGVSLSRATIIHYAEQLAGRASFVRWARAADGRTIPVAAGGCSRGFDRLRDSLSPFEKRAAVGKSLWSCYSAKDIVDTCAKEIAENPLITHCGDPLCSRCNDAVRGGPRIDGSFWTNRLRKEQII